MGDAYGGAAGEDEGEPLAPLQQLLNPLPQRPRLRTYHQYRIKIISCIILYYIIIEAAAAPHDAGRAHNHTFDALYFGDIVDVLYCNDSVGEVLINTRAAALPPRPRLRHTARTRLRDILRYFTRYFTSSCTTCLCV